ncbi:MAG: thioredoxin family protein [Balneolaceae bacterium]
MAAVPSTMLELGTRAPKFSLNDTVSGQHQTLEDIRGENATLLAFICNHCPYVKLLKEELVRVGQDYMDRGVGMAAISSNDADQYPEDGPEAMREDALRLQYPFPYLWDEDQSAAKAYRAACTPDFFLFDADLKLIYRGRFDAARPGNGIPVTGRDLRVAMDAVLAGKPVSDEQIPSIGCNIKWKSGQEPEYHGKNG